MDKSSEKNVKNKDYNNKIYLHYYPPKFLKTDGTEIIGAKERWIEYHSYMVDDYICLRSLSHQEFWSSVINNRMIKSSLTTFLQKAPRYYDWDSLVKDKEVHEILSKLFQNVLVIFARLATNKESSTEFMKKDSQGSILYDNYIYSIPVILDICQLYGRNNAKVVSKIVESVFTMQLHYFDDLKMTVVFINKILQYIEEQFEDCPTLSAGESTKIEERDGAIIDVSFLDLEHIIIQYLDTVSTIKIFLENYPPALDAFKNNDFTERLISIYSNALPEMYKKVQLINKEEDAERFNKLKQFLDVTRIESLQLFRMILYKDIGDVLETTISISEEDVKNRVDNYLELISYALSETEFLADYIQFYPIDVDIDILTHIYPSIDPMKLDYINKVLYPPSNGINENSIEPIKQNTNNQSDSNISDPISEKQLVFLISEVKDILCDLDEEFILRCLRYYNYKSESVINAVLENSLPAELTTKAAAFPSEMERTSVSTDGASTSKGQYTNDDLDDLCEKIVSISSAGMNPEKIEFEHEQLHRTLKDKSHIKESREIYNRYSLVVDEYEDEYDDTYNDYNVGSNVQDDTVEVDRPFTMPRVLEKNRNYENMVDNEDDSDEQPEDDKNPDHFVQDPAKLRAKAEERMNSKRGRGGRPGISQERDVTGKPKGQGQEKSVLSNRNYKNTHKSSQANHNRRAGSSWKKRQGMIPS